MNLKFNTSLTNGYTSNRQKVRIMSETWVADNMYCPCCGNSRIKKLRNNEPVADFICEKCNEIFELKSKCGNFGKKIVDGAYDTMIKRIVDITNPGLFILQYSEMYCVTNLALIPKFFFVLDLIEKRQPLSAAARRAGWVGCNILYNNIPAQGKISIVSNGAIENIDKVVNSYGRVKMLQMSDMESRGWIIDVLNCVNSIQNSDFHLNDIYKFVDFFAD